MEEFDLKMKQLAQKENINMPLHTKQRINQQLISLEEGKTKKGFLRLKRRVVVFATIGVTTIGSIVFASDLPNKIINGISSFFEASPGAKYEADQNTLQQLEQSLGVCIEKEGVTLQVESVALDDNFLNIFYTMHSEEVIPKQDEQGNVAWLYAPNMELKIDGQPWEYMDNGQDTDAYLEDDHTVKVMRRVNVAHLQLPEKFNLEISFIEPCKKQGDWVMNIPVEKLQVASHVVEVNKPYQVNADSYCMNHQEANKTSFDLYIEKVIFSPLASQIIIREDNVVADEPFSAFAMFDQDGNYIDMITQWVGVSGEMKDNVARDGFEFIPTKDMKKLILVPITRYDREEVIEEGITYNEKYMMYEEKYPVTIEIPISELPTQIERGPLINYEVLELETTKDSMLLKFKVEGVAGDQLLKTEFYLLDENKKWMIHTGIHSLSIDRQTGIYTLRISNVKNKNGEVDLTQAKYITLDDGGYILPEQLLWDQAIEIDVSK